MDQKKNCALQCDNVKLKIYGTHVHQKLNLGETATQIHTHDLFCDSNEACIKGPLEDVERARTLIHLARPFCIQFKLSMLNISNNLVFAMIGKHFNVEIDFITQLETVVRIKGCEKEATQVMDATTFLINYLYEYGIIKKDRIVALQMEVEIPTKHRDFVKDVMDESEAWIVFPKMFDPSSNKVNVHIIGTNTNEVYEARKQLLGKLPITLCFNFPDDKFGDINEIVTAVGIKYKYIKIFVDKKQTEQNVVALSIWGIEEDIDEIYNSYQEILNLKTYTQIHPRDRECQQFLANKIL